MNHSPAISRHIASFAASCCRRIRIPHLLLTMALLVCMAASGQSVRIDTFYLPAGGETEGRVSERRQFPVIRTGSEALDAWINQDLRQRFTKHPTPGTHPDSLLVAWAGDQITYLDFEATYNQHGVLSIHISAEGCGANCSGWTDYFNYAVWDREWLTLPDIVDSAGGFYTRIRDDRRAQYQAQRQALQILHNDPDAELDQETYAWALEHYTSCAAQTSPTTFAIYPDRLVILEDCYLPRAIQHLSPEIALHYPLTEISDHLLRKL